MRPEVDQVQALLSDMGADMVAVIPATPAMMEGSLQQALEGGPVPYEQVGAREGEQSARWGRPGRRRAPVGWPLALVVMGAEARAGMGRPGPEATSLLAAGAQPLPPPTLHRCPLPPSPCAPFTAQAGPAPRGGAVWHVHVRGAGDHRGLQGRRLVWQPQRLQISTYGGRGLIWLHPAAPCSRRRTARRSTCAA